MLPRCLAVVCLFLSAYWSTNSNRAGTFAAFSLPKPQPITQSHGTS